MSTWQTHLDAQCPDACYYCKRDKIDRTRFHQSAGTPETPTDSRPPIRASYRSTLSMLIALGALGPVVMVDKKGKP